MLSNVFLIASALSRIAPFVMNSSTARSYWSRSDILFSYILRSKHAAIVEEMQKLNVPEVEATTYTYSVRMKYVEVRDEGVIDLLQKYNYYKQPAQINYSEFEGYTVQDALWVIM